MTSEQEMGELGAETLKNFFQQFDPPDEFSESLISILLEELMNAKVVSILSQQESTGNQINNSPSERINSNIEINIDTNSTITNSMAESNSKNNSRQ